MAKKSVIQAAIDALKNHQPKGQVILRSHPVDASNARQRLADKKEADIQSAIRRNNGEKE